LKKEDENTESVEYIKIRHISWSSDEANKLMEEDGFDADIGYRFKKLKGHPLTEIRLIDAVTPLEREAHEFGHFMQHEAENAGIKFIHDEEISFLFEDVMRNFLRKKLYKLYNL
jgi:hypothetical protein